MAQWRGLGVVDPDIELRGIACLIVVDNNIVRQNVGVTNRGKLPR